MTQIICIFHFLVLIFLTIETCTGGTRNKLFSVSVNDFRDINNKTVFRPTTPHKTKLAYIAPDFQVAGEDDNNTDYFFDFEGQQLNEWVSSGDWFVSSEGKINGDFSLRHSPQPTHPESVIFYPVGLNLNSSDHRWNISLKNGNWDPSTSNRFWYYLLADSSDPAALNGWAAGVNIAGNSDWVELWRFRNGKPDSLVVQSNMLWKANTQFTLEIERKGKGQWSLCSVNNSGEKENYAEGADASTFRFDFIGLHFDFTSTRAGQLWADDIALKCFPLPPFVEKITVINEEQAEITFNKEISSGSVAVSDFKLYDESGKIIPVISAVANPGNPKKIMLTVEPPSEFNLNLDVSGISDLSGTEMKPGTLSFCWVLPCREHSLVVNEIFADPNPPEGLPEYEYIELFNRSAFPVSLSGLVLKVDDKKCLLESALLYPGKFLLLTNTEGAALLEAATGLKSFPTLRNSGAKISIETSTGLLVDEISYSDIWYADEDKKNGGWSLERIDPQRFCGQAGNWTASVAPAGGSPGELNSVAAANPDNKSPEMVSIEIISANELKLTFSENILPELLADSQHYSVTPAMGNPALIETSHPAEVVLSFPKDFIPNTNYSLQISDLTDECGNPVINNGDHFVLQQLVAGDILISEVLFNPYPGGADFVEIYNHSQRTINLKNLCIANHDGQSELNNIRKICNSDRWLSPGEYVLCTADSSATRLFYYTPCPECFCKMSSFPSYPDDQGTVVLLDDSSQVLDEFTYSEKMHHPLLGDCEGVSLERLSFEAPTESASNWHSAASTVGFATPGYANSQVRNELQPEGSIALSPEVFSPNNDGYNDRLIIHYQLDKPGYSGHVKVYDSQGRLINHLAKNELLGQEGDWYWDGQKADNSRSGLGIYIVLVELFDTKGNVKKYRKTCTLTDRL
ncbi:MAG: lamin tail domain-containing protein [Prolixibacteraceae bacterium]|jgi:hypothetical protein|nr:lamin tail domain-containing protein [Prolixibacteraceae bacterium]